MPELPEVEVTCRRLEPRLVGRRIASVRTTRPSYLFLTSPARLRRELPGRTVESLSRRGKYLIAGLEGDRRLIIHLGMTGQLFCSGAESVRLMSRGSASALTPEQQAGFRPDRHTHLRLGFEDRGPDVFLRDVRKFGKLMLLGPGQDHPRLDRLGVDALEVSGEGLFRASRGRRAAITNLLLDQGIIAGVGNIYADEALFLARLRPSRRAGRVTRRECEELAGALRRVMLRSIETGGSSIRDYVAPDGRDGAYQDERLVYAREREPCYDCSGTIRKTVVGQRGTHYCPTCQR